MKESVPAGQENRASDVAMPTELYHPESPFITYKALQLLYAFHALRQPNTHPESVYVEHTDKGLSESYWDQSPEFVMDRPLPVSIKAAIIKDLFVPVIQTLAMVEPDNPVEHVAEYCQAQIHSQYDAILADTDGIIAAASILPNPKLLRQMHKELVIKRQSRSRALEQFIAQLVTS